MNVRQDNKEAVYQMIDDPTKVIEPNWTDESGNGYLYLTCLNGYGELAEYFIQLHCEVNILNKVRHAS